MHPGTGKKNISTWNSLRDSLFLAREHGLGHHRSLSLVSRVRFVIQEDRLYIKFVERRVILGFITDDQWFKNTMDELLIADMPKNWQQFCASDGWVAGFKKRYRISLRCQINKKITPLLEKLPKLKKFHSWLADLRQSGAQRCH
jgi:hypothetical protein